MLGYAILMLYFRAGWTKMNELKIIKDYTPHTKVSIIIPARNEEKSIGILIKNILAQIYPPELTEIIVIDDHSTDTTSTVVGSFPTVKLITLADFTKGKVLNAYKKKAIETGIKQSSGELIITTDADCAMCEFWLLSIVYFYECMHHKLIAAPVAFFNKKNWFQIFQSIDFFTMQGVTGALSYFKSGTMCNGANLAYTRKAFDHVKGFDGIDDIASGDDMLLMYKIEKAFPGQTSYLKCKDAIVYTDGMNTIQSFLQQRIRWASKATKFKDKRIQFILACVFFFNVFLLLVLLFAIVDTVYLKIFILLLLTKGSIELSLLLPVSRFFKKEAELYFVYILQIIHIPYILISALLSQFGTYSWKDRQVK
jgi:cellulose synthase/poly-beta-1,6-N-acetylglucosamine synthase-like glycosyltransferase